VDFISTWSDTAAAWLGGLGGVVSAVIAGWALYRSARAEARHVEWQLSNERTPEGRRSETWRLVNTASGVRAEVVAFENVSDGSRDALRESAPLPAVIEPGHWLPFNHSRSMVSPNPTVVRVTWREGAPHRRFRRRRYTSTLFID